MNKPIFYFTVHPKDMIPARLMFDSSIMLVASAVYRKTKGLRVHRPPKDYIKRFTIDGGGFTASQKWGEYPWSCEDYVMWVREETIEMPAEFVAAMDYACEKAVDRSYYETNRQRIDASIENELKLRNIAPNIPWLSVLQGYTIEEREYDIEKRAQLGLLPEEYAGIGTICGESPKRARDVIRFYNKMLPDVKYHAFGLDIRALDADDIFFMCGSWDTYSWCWGRGMTEVLKPDEYFQDDEENYDGYTKRLAKLYWKNTVLPRLNKTRSQTLF